MNIEKKLLFRIKIFSITLILLSLIFIPDVAMHLAHSLVIKLFETIEGILDEIIAHLFDTDRRTTQIIVFYLMWLIFGIFAYKFFKTAKRKLEVVSHAVAQWKVDQVSRFKDHQHKQLKKKIKYLLLFGGATTACFGFLMS